MTPCTEEFYINRFIIAHEMPSGVCKCDGPCRYSEVGSGWCYVSEAAKYCPGAQKTFDGKNYFTNDAKICAETDCKLI